MRLRSFCAVASSDPPLERRGCRSRGRSARAEPGGAPVRLCCGVPTAGGQGRRRRRFEDSADRCVSPRGPVHTRGEHSGQAGDPKRLATAPKPTADRHPIGPWPPCDGPTGHASPSDRRRPAWLDELDPRSGPAVALRWASARLDLDAWLVIDDRVDAELALKDRLLDRAPRRRLRRRRPATRSSRWRSEVLELDHRRLAGTTTPMRAQSRRRSVPPRPPDHATATSSAVGRVGGTRWTRPAGWSRRTCA